MIEHQEELMKLRAKCRVMARKLAWWCYKVNHESTDEDTVADAANDGMHAISVLRSLGAQEDIDALRAAYPHFDPHG